MCLWAPPGGRWTPGIFQCREDCGIYRLEFGNKVQEESDVKKLAGLFAAVLFAAVAVYAADAWKDKDYTSGIRKT